jgi:hypothetical protein
MKKTVFILFIILFTGTAIFAQSPGSFKYQAVVRDASGNIITNHSVGLLIEILQGSETGTVVYSETHTPETNAFGLININVGQGDVQGGVFDAIDWGADTYFMKVSLDVSGGTTYVEMGTGQFQSVPYAIHSKSVEGISADDIINWNNAAGIWTQDGNNIYYNQGNVGIGTSNPNARLEVQTEGFIGDTLFCVKDNFGRPVFIVFPDAIQLIVDTTSTARSGAGGRFLVSGRGLNKNDKVSHTNVMNITNENYLIGNNVAPNINPNPTNGLGCNNSVMGYKAGNTISTGYENTVIGYQAGFNILNGASNIYIGNNAGFSAQQGFGNINIGYSAGYFNNNDPGYNVFMGFTAGYHNTDGMENIFIGKEAGFNGNAGNDNVYIGLRAGYYNNGDGNIFIGTNAANINSLTNVTNKLFIDNSATTTPLIWGDFDSNTVKIYSNLNVNNAYTFPTVDGSSGQVLTTNGGGTVTWVSPVKLFGKSEEFKQMNNTIQDLQTRIKELENENEKIRKENQTFEERLKALENKMNN